MNSGVMELLLWEKKNKERLCRNGSQPCLLLLRASAGVYTKPARRTPPGFPGCPSFTSWGSEKQERGTTYWSLYSRRGNHRCARSCREVTEAKPNLSPLSSSSERRELSSALLGTCGSSLRFAYPLTSHQDPQANGMWKRPKAFTVCPAGTVFDKSS